MSQLHIMADGQSHDIAFAVLDLGDLSTDQQVRDAAANYLGEHARKFTGFQIDRNPESGDITLRPQAIFG